MRLQSNLRLTATWVTLAAVAILFLRRPDAFLFPQFWAEDFIFLLQAQLHGWGALRAEYSGYLHAIPRLIAMIAAPLDPVVQPGVFVGGSLLVTLGVMWSALSPRLDLPNKPLIALVVVLVPHSGEVFLNPTNAQWIAALGLLLMLLKRDPVTRGDWCLDVGTIVLSGLSGPFLILLIPFMSIRAWARRTRVSFILLGISLGVAGIQAMVLSRSSYQPGPAGVFSLQMLLANLSLRFEHVFLGNLVKTFSQFTAISIGAIGVICLGMAVTFAKPIRTHLFMLLAFAFALLAVSALRVRFDLLMFGDLHNGDRYFVIPKIVVLWTLVSLLPLPINRWIRGAAMVGLMMAVVLNASLFKFVPYDRTNWYEQADNIRAGREVKVVINPGMEFDYQRPMK
ncbi:MAG TPA: hypothetical protein PLN52_06020 [Opitutaceae bacterium]|nr:hypothetical protein [Opitutaceae bacterium]